MKDENTILYVQTSNAPERQYSPLVLAQTAKAMDLNPAVYYLGMGLMTLLPGEAEKMQLGTLPQRARDAGQDDGDGDPDPTCARRPSRCSAGRRSSSSTA